MDDHDQDRARRGDREGVAYHGVNGGDPCDSSTEEATAPASFRVSRRWDASFLLAAVPALGGRRRWGPGRHAAPHPPDPAEPQEGPGIEPRYRLGRDAPLVGPGAST